LAHVIAVAALFLIVCLTALILKRGHVRGTTLTAVWWWLFVTVLGAGGAGLLLACYEAPRWGPALQFSAVCLSFCPSMAVLGAKRPQHTAWTFITASLWVVLVLPAGEQLLFQPGQPLEIHDARSFFLLVLTGVCLANHLPTRFWLPAILLTAAQVVALQPHLPLLSHWDRWSAAPLVSLVCGGAAILLTAWRLPALGVYQPDEQHGGVNQLWRNFRDCYGALWSVRILQRMEIVAQQQNWPITLMWTGFINRDDLHPVEPQQARVQLALFNLLRRFLNTPQLRASTTTDNTEPDRSHAESSSPHPQEDRP